MIIFTPNTVIRSTEVNSNFEDLDSRLSCIRELRVWFNNGTGSRSTTTSGTLATLPGATGDTSYTAPRNVSIIFTMTHMMNQTGGAGRVFLRINSTNRTQGMYFDSISGGWQIQTIQYPKYNVNAGETITIGAQWSTGAGTLQITNATGDENYPNEIIGLVIPR